MKEFFCIETENAGPEGGFSLLEVLIAMAVLSLSASVFMGAQMASLRAARVESERAAAIAVAETLDAPAVSTAGKVCGKDLSALTDLPDEWLGRLCAKSSCQLDRCAIEVWGMDGKTLLERAE